MQLRLARVLPAVAAVIVLSACNEATRPTALEEGSGGSGNDTQCVGFLPSGVYDNVVVPSGATCTLVNSTILGSIKALEGSQLVTNRNTVRGNIQGDKALRVNLFGDRVDGNIEIVEGGANPFFYDHYVCGAILSQGNIHVVKSQGRILVGQPAIGCTGNVLAKGNIKVEDNRIAAPDYLFVGGNQVAQNLQVYKNVGSGVKTVQGNTAGESVQCFDNQLPFVGGPNTAPKREGQCP